MNEDSSIFSKEEISSYLSEVKKRYVIKNILFQVEKRIKNYL